MDKNIQNCSYAGVSVKKVNLSATSIVINSLKTWR